MPDGPGEPVDDRLLIFMNMTVGMGYPVGMKIGMVMLLVVAMSMSLGIQFIHSGHLLIKYRVIIPQNPLFRKPRRGIFWEK